MRARMGFFGWLLVYITIHPGSQRQEMGGEFMTGIYASSGLRPRVLGVYRRQS